MSLEEQTDKFKSLDEWFVSDQGFKVLQAFMAELMPVIDILYGESFLQLGACGDNSLFAKLRYTHKWIASPRASKAVSLVSSLNQLPIDRDSIDCVFAPLALDAFQHKESLIDEIDRVLKPCGYVVFFGVNPLSLWGLWLRTGNHTCFGNSKVRLKSVLTVKKAMLHRGYVQCYLSSFYYIPPVKQKYWIEKFEIFNEAGKLVSLMPSAFYCFIVQKQQKNMVPLTPLTGRASYLIPVTVPLQPTASS